MNTDELNKLLDRFCTTGMQLADCLRLMDKHDKSHDQGGNMDQKLIDRFYTTGMQLADCLRLMGKHDESHEVEVWVLALCKEYRK
jgi:hypothetical protein